MPYNSGGFNGPRYPQPPGAATLRNAVYAALAQSPAVGAIVGANIFPIKVPSTVTWPALTYQLRTNKTFSCLDGPTGLARAIVQFTCASKVIAQCDALAEAIRNLFDGFSSDVDGLLGGLVWVHEATLGGSRADSRDAYVKPDPTDPSDQGVYESQVAVAFRYKVPLPVR